MSTPKIPPINPDDLVHQADAERVARIWTRLEPEVSAIAGRRARSLGGGALRDKLRRPRATTWLVAAAMGGVLAAGIWIGRSSISGGRGSEDPAIAITPSADATLDVFASGSQMRTFTLPNGGSLTLDPESTVEVAEVSEATMVLRLLRGTASIDGTRMGSGSISIVAGEARMTAPAGGSMAVRRNAKDVDVTAMGRSVEIDSPLGHQTIASGQRLHAVPTHTTTARVVAPAPRSPIAPSDPDVSPMPVHSVSSSDALTLARDPDPTEPVDPPTSTDVKSGNETPDWLVKYQANKWRDALDALNESGGAAAAIDRARSPGELALLCDLMRQAKNDDLAIKAAKRLVDEFPGDPQAAALTVSIANMYAKRGQTDLANEYLARAGKSPLGEDAVCRRLGEGSASDPAIITLAQEYIAKYSTSTFPALCMEAAQAIVSEAAAEARPADPPETAPSSGPSATPSTRTSASAAPSASPSAAPAKPPAAPPQKSAAPPAGEKPSDPPPGK